MKKNNKIIALGLGLSLLFTPISGFITNNANLVHAEEIIQEDEKNYDEFIKEVNEFLNSDQFKSLDEESQNNFKELTSDLKSENLDYQKVESIKKGMDEINLVYIHNKYTTLKEEVMKLKAENLSDELIKELGLYEDEYQTYEEYEEKIINLENTKKSIETYNNDLKDHKEILRKTIEVSKSLKIEFKSEEDVLKNEKSKLSDIDNAIENLNKEIDKYNENIKKGKRKLYLKALEEIIKGENSTKQSENYKRATKNLKEDFDKSVQAAKDAYKKLSENKEVNNINQIIDKYNSSFDKLDGEKNLSAYNNLVEFYNENRDKLSSENQKKYDKLVEDLIDSEDISSNSISELKESIEKDIKKDGRKTGSLVPVRKSKIGVRKSSPKVKKSRSFVRTGVKSVWIFLAILIIALLSYFFISKKDKK